MHINSSFDGYSMSWLEKLSLLTFMFVSAPLSSVNAVRTQISQIELPDEKSVAVSLLRSKFHPDQTALVFEGARDRSEWWQRCFDCILPPTWEEGLLFRKREQREGIVMVWRGEMCRLHTREYLKSKTWLIPYGTYQNVMSYVDDINSAEWPVRKPSSNMHFAWNTLRLCKIEGLDDYTKIDKAFSPAAALEGIAQNAYVTNKPKSS